MRVVTGMAALLVVASHSLSAATDATYRAEYLQGYESGYRQSYGPAYVGGFNEGLSRGRADGYDAGYEPAFSALYDQATSRATDLAYERAYPVAFEAGRQHGAAELERIGHSGGLNMSAGADYSIWLDPSDALIWDPSRSGLELGYAHGASQGRQAGYDAGYPLLYDRALNVGRADASLEGPLEGALDGLDLGTRTGLAQGWQQGLESVFGEHLPSELAQRPSIDLPALDYDRFLADVLGGDTLSAIRAGRVQGVDSIPLAELTAFEGTIEVPEIDPARIVAPTPISQSGLYFLNVQLSDFAGSVQVGGFTEGSVETSGFCQTVAAVPEPGTWLLGVGGLAALLLDARRRTCGRPAR